MSAALALAFLFSTTAEALQESSSRAANAENPSRIDDAAGRSATGAPVDAAAFVGEKTAKDFFARDTYALTPIICPFKGQVEYDPAHVSCGLLDVPENREKSRGRSIQLHYVKIEAREPDDWDTEENGEWFKRDDPIIYLTGGPGAKAAGYVTRFVNHGVRDTRDLYVLEQRGIGFSGDYCELYRNVDPAAGNTPDPDQKELADLAAIEACFARAKSARVDLSAYNTIENARDVKALRRALAFDRWNVWGISYGSILGQAYLKEDPEGVRAAVIDAIVPIDPSINFQGVGRYFSRTLDILQSTCNDQPKCASAYPDFVEKLKKAMISVSEEPIEVDAIDPELFPAEKAWFFPDFIGGLVFTQFYEQKNYPVLPAFIDALSNAVLDRNYEAFRVLTAPIGDDFFDGSIGMYNAIACNDGWVTSYEASLQRDAADYPVLSLLNGDPAYAGEPKKICARYGMRARDTNDYAPVATDIRTLVVEGAMDPITPPPYAQAIMPGFSNGDYVEFAYAGHGPSRSVKCAGDFLTSFYDDPNGDLDRTCPQSMEPPKFVTGFLETPALANFVAMAAEDEKALAKPGVWAGASSLILLIGAIIYTLAPAARLVNGERGAPTGGARLAAWATSLAGVAAAGGIAYAVYATIQASELLPLVGVLGIARWFALAGLAAGAFGLVTIVLTARARAGERLPVGVLLGLLLTGLAGLGVASFILANGFSPF